MKCPIRKIGAGRFLLLIAVSMGGVTFTIAQNGSANSALEVEKGRLFKLMSEHHTSLASLKAKVSIVTQTEKLGIAPTQRTGAIKFLAASDNSRTILVDLKRPSEIVGISNSDYTVYKRDLKEAFTGKLTNETANAGRSGLFKLFFSTPAEIQKHFRSVYLGKTTINGGMQVHQLTLTPLGEAPSRSFELSVDMAGMPVQLRVYEKNGDSTTLFLSKIGYNKKIDRSKLAVKLKKDTKIVREEPPVPIAVTVRRPIVPTKPPAARPGGGSIIREILARIDAHNRALTSLRANVTMVRQNAQLRMSETTEGIAIYLPIRGKDPFIRIDWTRPKESLVVINKQYRIYRPGVGQAYVGTIDTGKKNPRVRSALAFMRMTRAQLKENYTITPLGEETIKGGVKTWHLQLTPKIRTSYRFVDIWVDGNGMPLQMKVNEHNGDSTTVLLSNLLKNSKITASQFRVDLPEGTKIIRN